MLKTYLSIGDIYIPFKIQVKGLENLNSVCIPILVKIIFCYSLGSHCIQDVYFKDGGN